MAASLALTTIPQASHANTHSPPSPAETRELVASTTMSRSSFKDMRSLWNDDIDFEGSSDKKSDNLDIFDFEVAEAKEKEAAAAAPSNPPAKDLQIKNGERVAVPVVPTTDATPKATTSKAENFKSPKERPAKKNPKKTFKKATNKKKKITKVKRTDSEKKRIGLKSGWFKSKQQSKPKVALQSKKKKVVVVAARTAVAVAAAVVGTLLVIGGLDDEDDDTDEASSVFLDKKREPEDSGSKANGTNEAVQGVTTNTGKQLPPVNIEEMSARSRAMQAKMILNDIRESREKRKQAMEESHERVQAIQAQINATDEQLAAKKEATQASLQRLLQVQSKGEQENSDTFSSIEQRQQQRALDIAKSEETRLRRKQVQKNEEIRLRKEREMKSRKKTPAQIRAAQKEEQTRRTLMEKAYVGKELDLLEEKRKMKQQELETKETQHMEELKQKYSGLEDKEEVDIESTVLKDASVDQTPLSPTPANVSPNSDDVTSAQKAKDPSKSTETLVSGDAGVGSDEDSDREDAPSQSPLTFTKTTGSTLSKRTEKAVAVAEQKREAFARTLLGSRFALKSKAKEAAPQSQIIPPSEQEKANREATDQVKQQKELAARALLKARLARRSTGAQPLNDQTKENLEEKSASSENTNADEIKKRSYRAAKALMETRFAIQRKARSNDSTRRDTAKAEASKKKAFDTARALMKTRFAMEAKAHTKKPENERVENLKEKAYNTAWTLTESRFSTDAKALAKRESAIDGSTKEQQKIEEMARRKMLMMRISANQSSTAVSDSVRWSADTITSLGLKAKLAMMSAAGIELDISEMEPKVDSAPSAHPLNDAKQASQTGLLQSQMSLAPSEVGSGDF